MRWLLLLGSTLVVVAFVFFNWQLIVRRAELLYWQHLCMTHVAAPGQTVLDGNLSVDAVLAGGPGTYVALSGRSLVVCRLPPEWMHLAGLMPIDTHGPTGTIFLGRRKSPGGHERLVVVDVSGSPAFAQIKAHVIRPGFLITEPAECRTNLTVVGPGMPVYYTGQPDPADASRFSYQYDADGVRITVAAKLQDDDTVVFENVGSAPAPPAPAP